MEINLEFLVNINTNSLLVQSSAGNIPAEFETFQVLGNFIKALGKLNNEAEMVILFDLKIVPFIFIMYLNKVQKTLLKEINLDLDITIVTQDIELIKFIDGFKKSNEELDKNGIDPFKDIMDTMGAGNTELDEILIPDSLVENMPDSIKESISRLNELDISKKQEASKINNVDNEDINIEALNKIKFIYKPR